jgi:hypothetical protein
MPIIFSWFAAVGGFDTSNRQKFENKVGPNPFIHIHQIAKAIVHPNYDSANYLHNIALLKFKNSIDSWITPICLPMGKLVNPLWPETFYTASWTDFENNFKLPLVTARMKPYVDLQDKLVTTAFSVGKTNCTSLDVGATLQAAQKHANVRRYVLYGVKILDGDNCWDPDTYLDITKYLDWIVKTIMNRY